MKSIVNICFLLVSSLLLFWPFPACASGNAELWQVSSKECLQRGKEYHACGQFEMAGFFYRQAFRLDPGGPETVTLIEASARHIGRADSPAIPEENANYRQEVQAFIDRLEGLLNLHNIAAVSGTYADNYIDADGLNKEQTLELLNNSWKLYPNLKTSFGNKNISVHGNFAVVECIQQSVGLTAEPMANAGFARISSQARGKLFLERRDSGWIVIATEVAGQQERDDCGVAVNLPMFLYGPSTCEAGGKYSVQVQASVPAGFATAVSVNNMQLQYPPQRPRDDFVTASAGLTKTLKANQGCRNELATATVRVFSLQGGGRNLVGICMLAQRVNVVPPANAQADERSLRAAVQSALQGVQPFVIAASSRNNAKDRQDAPSDASQASQGTTNQGTTSWVSRQTDSQAPHQLPNSTASSSDKMNRVHKDDRAIRDKWALIIGISHFAKPEYNLKYAAKDARDFYNYLINEAGFRADHVLLLTDEQASKVNIMEAFGEKFLPAVTEEGDLVVVFVSTHGTPANRDKGGRNYIAAWDTDVDKLYGTGVDMDEINRRIKESVKSDRVLIVLDTCYSGAGVPGAKGMHAVGNFDAEEMATGSGHLVISSSSQSERSWESKVAANGVFTRYFLEALRKKNAKIDVRTAFDELKKNVSWEVKSAYGESQTPRLGGDWQGRELVLSMPATEPRRLFNEELLKMMAVGASGSASPDVSGAKSRGRP